MLTKNRLVMVLTLGSTISGSHYMIQKNFVRLYRKSNMIAAKSALKEYKEYDCVRV